MGADLYFETKEGEKVGYFRDAYNPTSLFGLLTGTLGKNYSWWLYSSDETLVKDCIMDAAGALKLHDILVEALVELSLYQDDFIQKFDGSIVLSKEDRQDYFKQLVELLVLLRKTYQNDWIIRWNGCSRE